MMSKFLKEFKTIVLVIGITLLARFSLAIFLAQSWIYATRPSGNISPLLNAELFNLLVFALSLAGIFVALLLFFIKNLRYAGYILLVVSFASLFLTSLVDNVARNAQDQAFTEFASRVEILVQAIERFERENGKPPATLDELVPNYLQNVPKTGMGAFPNFYYSKGDGRYDRGRWSLSVGIAWLPLDFTHLEFRPAQDYDKSQTRYGRWAIKIA